MCTAMNADVRNIQRLKELLKTRMHGGSVVPEFKEVACSREATHFMEIPSQF